jgi:hypothetical protein
MKSSLRLEGGVADSAKTNKPETNKQKGKKTLPGKYSVHPIYKWTKMMDAQLISISFVLTRVFRS